MKKLQVTTTYIIYENIEELDYEVQQLIQTAIEVRDKAYTPYSKFNVGVAILLDNQEIVTGNNQENAAFPSGMCAERVAIYSAGANYPKNSIQVIAISASSSKHKVTQPIAPCGACRQSIAEYENKQNEPIEIYFMGETGAVIKINSLKDLLPFGFDSSYL